MVPTVSALVLALVGLVVANESVESVAAYKFQPNEPPRCFVTADGHTVVQYKGTVRILATDARCACACAPTATIEPMCSPMFPLAPPPAHAFSTGPHILQVPPRCPEVRLQLHPPDARLWRLQAVHVRGRRLARHGR